MKHDVVDDPMPQTAERQPQNDRTPSREAPGRRRAVFVGPAPLVDVLTEQVEYLVGHLSANCSPGCPDCMRLELAMLHLMRPFR